MVDNIQHTTYNNKIMAMIRRQIYIPEDLYIKAKGRGRLEGKNFSEVVRDGIKLSLDKNVYIDVKKRKGFESLIGKYTTHGAVPDMYKRHNEIYDI